MRREQSWRTAAIPLIAAAVATTIVVSTGTRVVPGEAGGEDGATLVAGSILPPTTMALNATEPGETLVAEVTPAGLAMAQDWLKPCLSQGIKVQPPNTPYPTLTNGIQLPNPLDPNAWHGFDCHLLDNQLMVPNWIDPNDIYGSALRHTQPQDQDRMAQLLQQVVAAPPQEQQGVDWLELLKTILQWLRDYGWIFVLALLLAKAIAVVTTGQRQNQQRADCLNHQGTGRPNSTVYAAGQGWIENTTLNGPGTPAATATACLNGTQTKGVAGVDRSVTVVGMAAAETRIAAENIGPNPAAPPLTRDPHVAGCHLIAAVLGGSRTEASNFVPCWNKSTNAYAAPSRSNPRSSGMKKVELNVQSLAAGLAAKGEAIYLIMTPVYRVSPEIPTEIDVAVYHQYPGQPGPGQQMTLSQLTLPILNEYEFTTTHGPNRTVNLGS